MPRLPFAKSSPPASPRDPERPTSRDVAPPPSPNPERRRSFGMDRLSLSKEKRRSLVGDLARRPSSPKNVPPTNHAAKLEIVVESPPLIFYGSSAGSTGALLGGQLKVAVTDAEVTLETLSMRLQIRTHFSKPVVRECNDCATRTEEVFAWTFLREPKKLVRGTHSFPFSYLLPGTLAASTHSRLATIDYALAATAKTASNDTIRSTYPIELKRAMPEPTMNRTSDRIFPPTNLKTQLEHAPVMYPIGEHLCLFRINGIVHQDKQAKFRWRLRRLTWTINEVATTISPPCSKHVAKASSNDKGGIEHKETRQIGQGEIKNGWKSDFSPEHGTTDLEFKVSVNPAKNATCDVHALGGKIDVKHQLVVELIISEEVSHLKHEHWSATGSARVLRAQHVVQLSERTGMGISWDEEQPPMYEDVPESPPYYNTAISDFVGEIPEDDELELGS